MAGQGRGVVHMTEEILNLFDSSILETTKKEVADILDYNKVKEAHFLAKKINVSFKKHPNLKEKDSSLWGKWQNLLVKLQWISFPFLSFENVIKIFKNNLVDAFNLERYPLEKNLKVKLLTIPLLEERDIYKKTLREAIIKNNQVITTGNILIDKEKVKPTISNWIREYNRVLGSTKVDKLKQIEFLTKNQNIVKLSPEEKEKIKRLFDLYEKLKKSSLEPEGLEEGGLIKRADRLEIYEKGAITDIIRMKASPAPAVSAKAEESISLREPQEAKKLPLEEAEKKIPAWREEEEIKAAEGEIEAIKKETPAATGPIDISQAVENVISQAGLAFPDEVLATRFKNIANSYFKEVRDEIGAKEALTKNEKIGGMEVSEAKADEIIKILQKEKPKIEVKAARGAIKPELAEELVIPEEVITKRVKEVKPIKPVVPPEIKLPKAEIKAPEVEEKIPEPEEKPPLGLPLKKGEKEAPPAEEKKPLPPPPAEVPPPAPPIKEEKLPPSPPPLPSEVSEVKEEEIKIPEVSKPEEKPVPPLAPEIPEPEEKPEPEKKEKPEKGISKLQKELEAVFKKAPPGPSVLEEKPPEAPLHGKEKPLSQPEAGLPSAEVVEGGKKAKFEMGPLAPPEEIPARPLKEPGKEPLVPLGKKKPEEVLEKKELEAAEEKVSEELEPIPLRRPISPPLAKPRVEEVKVTPKIYGPIDELRATSLADWRGWGSPEKATEHLQDKINLLADQSLTKKARGIKAWKESEVNQLYLEIGIEAIEKGKSIEEVISLRQQEYRPTLSIDEFNAIAELNQTLRV